MLKKQTTAWLVATTFMVAPALAQTGNPPAGNPPAGVAAPAKPMQNVNAAEFVNKAANSNMFEIQSSQLAVEGRNTFPMLAW